jgi:serine/threonine-protein kinase ULK/ATG1
MQKYNNNDNIIKLYDVLYSDKKDYLYMILEYCDCGDLYNFIKNNKLTEEQIKYYMNQLKNGLQYLRDNNIIHRDIKPKNILLTNNNKILKICDFGFAKSIIDDVSLMETLCGSPLYMAPEIINNKKYNIKSDLWSVGIILYEIIYNKHPLGEPVNILDLMEKIKK